MVVLTVLTNSNDHTVYFDEPIEKFEFIRLIKCYLYNSWYNLKNRGVLSIFDDQNAADINIISPGNYTIKSMGKKLQDIFTKEGIKVQLFDETGSIVIENPLKNNFFHRNLTSLFGLPFEENKIYHKLRKETSINRFYSFNNYLIKCDLLDKNENFFNGNKSDVLGCYVITGQPFERVIYSQKQTPFRKVRSGKFVQSMKISVTDENGELIDFNGFPLIFEFEII